MIITVKLETELDANTTLSHQTEVVVDDEAEACLMGAEFRRLMLAFNIGIIQAEAEQ